MLGKAEIEALAARICLAQQKKRYNVYLIGWLKLIAYAIPVKVT